jgi:His/Glu/Gln/Arg/opine family amino acid ABC transporter permease subunit
MNFLELLRDFNEVAGEATPLLMEGLQFTVLVSVCAIVIGIVIGLIACLMRMSHFFLWRWIASAYIWVVRGTPMIVQAFFIHFGLPQIISLFIPEFTFTVIQSSIITTSLNAGAYIAEIFRGGITAVPKGQTEAARSLGLSQGKTMRKVVLPQATKIAIPSMVNQFIITIKDTSILSVIGLPELTNKTKIYVGATFNYFASWIFVGLFYLILISILMIILKKVEASFSYERKN